MFANYITFRNILRHKYYVFISIMGLALGMACFTILFLLIKHETNYDTFHQKSERIVRITEIIKRDGIGEYSASVPFPLASILHEKYPEYIESTVRLFNFQAPFLPIKNPTTGEKFNEKCFFFADSTFLEIFDFELQIGDPKTALDHDNAVIITPQIAHKYFKTTDVLGKKIVLRDEIEFVITGVFKATPSQSHIKYDFIASLSTLDRFLPKEATSNRVWNPCWTYILLKKNHEESLEKLKQEVPKFISEFSPTRIKDFTHFEFQKLEDIHLFSNLKYELSVNGDANYVSIFRVMSVFVLIIAMINFMNLAMVRSSLRAQETILRKASGASKQDLRIQFLIESILISLIAVLPAFIMVELILPFLSDLSGNPVGNNIINQTELSVILVLTSVITGFLSGIYPAYYLSSFVPSTVFNGAFVSTRSSKFVRRLLVVIQFVISFFLIISTIISNQQLNFMQNARLGFDKEHKIILPIGWVKNILGNYEPFKSDLTENQDIVSVTAMEMILGKDYQTHAYKEKQKANDYMFIPSMIVREDFINTFEMKLIAGRDFTSFKNAIESHTPSQEPACLASDPLTGALIVNEAYVKFKGWTVSEAIGKNLSTHTNVEEHIIGVVENFHFASLRDKITPFILYYTSDRRKFGTKYLVVKVKEGRTQEALACLRTTWKSYSDTPMDYFFLDDSLSQLYAKEKGLSEISGGFALVSILVACMGLFGLMSFVTEQRRREISIRKALGASNYSLIGLLSTEFLILVSIGAIISVPLSWYIMSNWLHSFSYTSTLDFMPFLWADFVIILIIAITILHVTRVVKKTPMHEINE